MIIIVESGSTKADWILLDAQGHEVKRWSIMGFNPYFHSSATVEQVLNNHPEIPGFAAQVSQVWFYGAGCSSDKLNNVIKSGLVQVFPNAQVNVDHDLKAAAYATFDGVPHVACILGTGSNSCFFDGQNIREEVPALAYVLGDEGSASFIGKRLVADFIYKRLPSELQVAFEQQYKTDKDEIFHHVYHQPHANVYLASFSRFAGDHSESPYIQAIVREGFEKFLDIHVLCFEEARNGAPANFVGSVAKAFEFILKDCCQRKGITYGRTQAKPVNRLVEYHLNVLRVLDKAASA
jgi:N-acetylglucosamine kinase-like BadF-type ATPase